MKQMLLTLALVIPVNAQVAHYGHHGKYLMPDPKVTPGVINPAIHGDVHKGLWLINGVEADICAKGFTTKPFRKTTEAMKKKVCEEYGAKDCPNPAKGEIDHLVPLELGGKDVVENLWWQPAPEYHEKDHQVEDKLKPLVCKGKITLQEAQSCIQTDWVTCAAKVKELSSRN